ncbi:transcription elongation factor NusA [Sulfolobales archaeon HS-7]|nr:transcription elongation factor NusA [Sulfolobales archaeon HS-7]
MKLPLDYVCINSGLLCDRCQSLVDEGQIDDFEIEVMKSLIEIEGEVRELKDSTYNKSLQVNNLIIVVVTSGPDMTQQKWVKVAKMLHEKLGKKVRIIENTNNIKQGVIQVMFPARVLGVNTVWLPDGSVQHIVRITKEDKKVLPASDSELETLLSKLYSTQIKIRAE